MYKRCVRISDDRYMYFYSEERPPENAVSEPCNPRPTEPHSELRWHPILRQWVINATHRQQRTYRPPAEYCPLCPTKPGAFPTEVPEPDYDIVVFQNRFPSLVGTAPHLPGQTYVGADLYGTAPGQGECEVVLYSPKHDGTLWELGTRKIARLVDVWAERFTELSQRNEIQYILIFENRGEAVGVTLSHPHGQIYALPFVPPIPETELQSAQDHWERTNRCLFCDVLAEEVQAEERVVFENEHVTAFVPFFARFPYEVHLMPKRHVQSIVDLTLEERFSLAEGLQHIVQRYDSLWGIPVSYMMVMHQKPVDNADYPYAHFHIEFYPVNREADKLKYLAGCESGGGTFITDIAPEEQAKKLREIVLLEVAP